MNDFVIIGLDKIGQCLNIHRNSVKKLKSDYDLPIWQWQGRWVILSDDLKTWLIQQRNKNLDNKIRLALFENKSL
ncbi:MAG: hypothetical protein ACNI27_03680 [Desulfovibrio sp.]